MNMNAHCLVDGGTGVSPVKSGVSPDFDRDIQSHASASANGAIGSATRFWRDAKNYLPEAGATQLISNLAANF